MISLKSPQERSVMRENGRILAHVLAEVSAAATPGRSTAELDALAERLILEADARPAFKGYEGFPATLCTSINEEIVHGIPQASRRLKEGDIVSLDCGLVRNGMYVDAAVTIPVGEVSDTALRLLRTAKESLWRAIGAATIDHCVSDISHAIGSYVESEGLFVVRELVGHGIGRALHEEPQIPNYGQPGFGQKLKVGMALAIEPMVKLDDEPARLLEDHWTWVTGTGGLSAHFEHTVVMNEDGVEVLTQGGA